MRLKRLTLQGYKSFAAKTGFEFSDGITAIVGPNGSGKSNVADGIRWVLGEQSMRALRGKSTEDMIFAGARRRAQSGMAEVSLTLDNSDGWLPIDFSEVSISRRAYRSSQSEYLINGSRVRLRDITELLAESGLVAQTYAVIGQGAVDAALALRPRDRRTLFEEAAGISFYRSRREEAVGRLTETQHNLERVHDIINEIYPRLRRLQAEAEKTEEHRRLTADLRRLHSTWYGYLWGQAQVDLLQAQEKAATADAGLSEKEAAVLGLGELLGQVREAETELRTKLRDWHLHSAELHGQFDRVRRELAVAEERSRLLSARRDELVTELESLEVQENSQLDQVARTLAKVSQADLELAEQRGRLAHLELELAAAREREREPAVRRARLEQDLRDHRARLEQRSEEFLAARSEGERLAGEFAVTQERVRQLVARQADITADLQPLRDQQVLQVERASQAGIELVQKERDLEECRQRLASLERQRTARTEQAGQLRPRRVQLLQSVEVRRAALEQIDKTVVRARAEVDRLAGELEATSRLQEDGSAYGAAVKALVEADLDGVLGPLTASVRVPGEWQKAIEAALSDDAPLIVVSEASIADKVRQVIEPSGGRLVLLPLDTVRAAPALPAGSITAASVASYAANLRPAVEAILGAIVLCGDLASARRLIPDLPPGSRCATPQGTVSGQPEHFQ